MESNGTLGIIAVTSITLVAIHKGLIIHGKFTLSDDSLPFD